MEIQRTIAPLLAASLFLAQAPDAAAGIRTSEVTYRAGESAMKGWLAFDDASDAKRPVVLVVHEWWGHNGYARKRAEMLAELGYLALAVDMYGDGKTADHPSDAGAFAGAVMENQALAKERFEAALARARQEPLADPAKAAAIGYCFGGATVLNMARAGIGLAGVVSFHGSLGAGIPAETPMRTKVLVCHGAEDGFISEETIAAFKKEMGGAGADFRFIAYPGAKHSFTNPEADGYAEKFGLPVGYHREADEASWADMKQFLAALFR